MICLGLFRFEAPRVPPIMTICDSIEGALGAFQAGEPAYVLITEKRRLAMAAAAIKMRIESRRMPLVFLPVFPLRKGSATDSAMVVVG